MFNQWMNGDDKDIPYFTDEDKRLETISDMKSVNLIYERRRRAAEEENKRQLKLFDDDSE